MAAGNGRREAGASGAYSTPFGHARDKGDSTAVDAVRAPVAEFGFRQPVVVDKKLLMIVGHTRLEALGLEQEPADVAGGGHAPARGASSSAERRPAETQPTWHRSSWALVSPGHSACSRPAWIIRASELYLLASDCASAKKPRSDP